MNWLIDAPDSPTATLLLAHGAGAGMEHEWLNAMTQALCSRNLRVVRFEFPYMEKRRDDGKKRPPDRQPRLLAHFSEAVKKVKAEFPEPLFIAGKSMGGRMATLLPTEMSNLGIKGVLAYGFPLHPPGKEDSGRGTHLYETEIPTLIIQGERDTFGTQAELQQLPFANSVTCKFLTDGDHSFKPRKASGFTQEQHLETAAALSAAFVNKVLGKV